MNRLGVMLLAAFAAATQARAEEPAVAHVLKADSAFTEAVQNGDADAFDGLTTEEYVLTTSGGRVWDKAKNLQVIKKGTVKFDRIENEDRKVHLYGDVAVVTGLSKIKGKHKDEAFDDAYRWTRVWIRRSGEWKCVTEQMSQMLDPDDLKPKDK